MEAKKDFFPCDRCGKSIHIDLLDAKDDGTGNFTILECKECYGPGWCPSLAEQIRNFYRCSECGEEWEGEWSDSGTDSCPKCNADIKPYKNEDNL